MFLRRTNGGRYRKRLAQALFAALNDRDYDALDHLLASDFVFADMIGGAVSGIGEFRAAQQALHAAAPDLCLSEMSISHCEPGVLARTRAMSGNPDHCAEELWQLTFREGFIATVSIVRNGEGPSLPAILRRSRAQSGSGDGWQP